MAHSEVQGLDPAYTAFLERVVATAEVWGLSDEEGWALAPSALEAHVMVLPFWSDEADAAACASGEWDGFAPEPIPLDLFLRDWLPGMHDDDLRAGVGWSAGLDGVEAPPLELQADLEAAIAAAADGPDGDPDA